MKNLARGLASAAMVAILTLLAPAVAGAATAPVSPAAAAPRVVENWTVTELSFTSTRPYANPFLDVEVTATFIGPHGEVITRPGFWDGGSTWRVRFAPTSVGMWHYVVESSDPRNLGLLAAGKLRSVAYTGDREIFERGFLAAGGSTLTYADGSPFFWLGDTHWFFDRKESWGPVGGYDSQFKAVVDRRVGQEFTVYQSVVFGDDGRYWADDREGEVIDPTYFREQLDRKMAYIADSGLVNAFGVGFHSNIDDFVLGSQRLAEYVVARYGAYPMVWMTSGEGAGYDIGLREARIDGWRSVGRAIHAADDYDHPQAAHSPALTEKGTLGLPHFYEGEGWLDFEMLQGGHLKSVPVEDYHFYADQFGLPFLESEANYEQIYDGYATDAIVRRTAYRSIQAGGFGYGYGAHGIWNATRDGADTADDYGYGHRNWDDAIDFVGADQMTHLIRFYRSIPLAGMTFRSDSAAWAGSFTAGVDEPVVRADDDAKTVTVYFSPGTSSVGRLTDLDDTVYAARWFDPRSGASTAIGSVTVTDGSWAVPEKPSADDWLLVLASGTVGADEARTPPALTEVSTGKPITRFGGTVPRGQTVDLGAAYELASIAVQFPAPFVRNQYELEGSLDGAAWFPLADRSGAPVYGGNHVERVSGTARFVRLTLEGASRLAAVAAVGSPRSVRVAVSAKVGGYAAVRSTAYLVHETAAEIVGVPAGIDRDQFVERLTPTTNATLSVRSADGASEVMSGGIGDGMQVVATSQDGVRSRTYVVRTVVDLGENLALGATATASSVEHDFYSASAVNDGNADTESWSGWAANVFPAWVELEFDDPTTFTRVDLYTKKGYEQTGYSLQYWGGSQWIDIVSVSDNTADHRAHVFPAITASRLRLWTEDGNVRQNGAGEKVARLTEIEVYDSSSVLVQSLEVRGAEGASVIDEPGGTLQLTAVTSPSTASDANVAWQVREVSGEATVDASISADGLLTASGNGTVRVTATTRDGSALSASVDVEITGQEGEGLELLSSGRPASASTVNGPAEAATDGDLATAWVATGPEFPQWLMVDLGQERQVVSIRQVFNNADEWKYTIEGSVDGVTWTPWIDRTANTTEVVDVTHAVGGTARFVRLTVTGAKAIWPNWASSREFSIYGTS